MSDLGWGAGGVEEALQLYQSLQTGKLEQQQKQVALESSQLQLNNLKKLQASLGSGQFKDLSSSDPQKQLDSQYELANTYLANGFPEQAQSIAKMADETAKAKADATATKAKTTLGYLDTAEKLFSGVTTADQWHAAQQLMQAELPPEALKDPKVKALLTRPYSPDVVKIMPDFLTRTKDRVQAKLTEATTLHTAAETKSQAVDDAVKQETVRLDKVREDYLRRTGGFDEGAEGDSTGDKMSKLRYLVTAEGVRLPLGSRSISARNQFFADALSNNPTSTPEEIAQFIKAGQIGMKGEMTEAGKVAQREASIGAAQVALTEPNGLYDQLKAAAAKVNLGDLKTISQIRTGLQKHVFASPDIQAYVTTLEETRADLATVLSRSGQTTDQSRSQAAAALPETMSVDELNRAVEASTKATAAIMSGNTAVMNAIKSGKSPEEALEGMQTDQPKVFASAAAVEAARKIGRVKDGDKVFIGGKRYTWKDK